MNIYVGNLSFETTEDDLRTMFEKFGEVSSAKLITDQYTGKSRGFGFVEMSDNDKAGAAMAELNDTEVGGRSLKISESRPRPERSGPRGF
jgi:RNA recognition motif-containing protein